MLGELDFLKWLYPNYYRHFSCLMGACCHSCCTDWEIGIDRETRDWYREVAGEIGCRLAENIVDTDEGSSFCLTREERCPFLNAEGLCELIIELGEESLCQICADHPRFRNFFTDRTEVGLGLCCEAAAKLILTAQESFALYCEQDDREEEENSEEEEEILSLRDKLISLMQDRTIPVCGRVARFTEETEVEFFPVELSFWAEFFLGLERLDEEWTICLRQLQERPECAVEDRLPKDASWEIAFEQLMVYLLYRHLPDAVGDGDLSGRIAYVLLIWRLLRAMCCMRLVVRGDLQIEDLLDLARMYSSEIEYSDENMDVILGELHRLNPAL